MDRTEALGWATKLAAAYPRFPVTVATRSWWVDDFVKHERPVVVRALKKLTDSLTTVPSLAELRGALRSAALDVADPIRPALPPGEPVRTSSFEEWAADPANRERWDAIRRKMKDAPMMQNDGPVLLADRLQRESEFRFTRGMYGCCVGERLEWREDDEGVHRACAHGTCKDPDHPRACRARA